MPSVFSLDRTITKRLPTWLLNGHHRRFVDDGGEVPKAIILIGLFANEAKEKVNR